MAGLQQRSDATLEKKFLPATRDFAHRNIDSNHSATMFTQWRILDTDINLGLKDRSQDEIFIKPMNFQLNKLAATLNVYNCDNNTRTT